MTRASTATLQANIVLDFSTLRFGDTNNKKKKMVVMMMKRPAPSLYILSNAVLSDIQNKSMPAAQSNLGRGPRCGTVVHVRRKVPIGYNGAPEIRPQKYPFSWTDPAQTPLPALSLDPPGPAYDAKRNSDPIRRFSTMHWTDRRTGRPTDAQTDRSSTGKFDHYRPLRY